MRCLKLLAIILALSWLVPFCLVLSAGNAQSLPQSAVECAVSEDPTIAASAVQSLRAAGPAGLAALRERYRPLLEDPGSAASADPIWPRLHAALDAVAAQRDAQSSGLYWYTDLNQARAAAQEQNKPILSLRLLGKLTDEYSCANSRFFRTALYANHDVSTYLRDRFVLHWQSVRPVPRVTIDFGDGRKLERTLTGNSIHYILDSSAQPVDALPGLYGPAAFLRHLRLAEDAAQRAAVLAPGDRANYLIGYHRSGVRSIQRLWSDDLARLEIPLPPAPQQRQAQAPGQAVNAEVAALRALPKSKVESPLLRALAVAPVEALNHASTEEVWSQIASLHAEDAALDQGSVDVIARQNPPAEEAGELTITKYVEESPLLRMVRNFQKSMAIDSVRNEYELHRQIHDWLIANPAQNLDELNERVYSELFLTPSSDPWLGLLTQDTYTALQNGGRRNHE